jgi:hypothetical protein
MAKKAKRKAKVASKKLYGTEDELLNANVSYCNEVDTVLDELSDFFYTVKPNPYRGIS